MHSGVGSYIGAAHQVAIGRNPRLLSGPERLYLDHAATTPILPEAQAAMANALRVWANPSSPHGDGRQARVLLEEARKAVAQALGWRHDVIFTSGASEALQIVAARAKAERRIVGATEHEAVVAAMGPSALALRVDSNGVIDMGGLQDALSDGPALVAIQQVNNETGVVQPLDRIYRRVSDSGSLLLADCAQGAGKLALPDADFIAISAHKLGGPPGVGALLVKDLALLEASGGQERGYRRGTENLPGIAALAAALESRAFLVEMPRLAALRQQLESEIAQAGGVVIAEGAERIATIGGYAMPSVASASQLVQLDLADISVSAGSACSSGSMKPSRVLAAMHAPAEVAASVIRVSFGPSTSGADVSRFLNAWRGIAERAKARAA